MTSSLDSVIGQQGVDSMTESNFDSVIESTGCRLMIDIQVWILSWSTGCRLSDRIKFGFCHGQQGVDSMTSSLDSVIGQQGVDT